MNDIRTFENTRMGAAYRDLFFHQESSERSWVAFCVFFLCLVISALIFALKFSTNLDDAYIYFRSTENFLSTGAPVFNLGDRHALVTSPIWLLFLTSAKRIFSQIEYQYIAKFGFIFFLCISSVLLFKMIVYKARELAVLAPIPIFFAPSMPSLVGHDTALALASSLFLIYTFMRHDYTIFPVAAAFCYLSRGEGAVLALGLIFLLLLREKGTIYCRTRSLISRMRIGILVSLTCVFLWHYFYFYSFGTFFPNTLGVKIIQGKGDWPLFYQAFFSHLQMYYGSRTIGIIFLVVSTALAVSMFPIILFWVLLHCATYVILSVAYYHWYYYPVEFWFSFSTLFFAFIVARSVLSVIARIARTTIGRTFDVIKSPALAVGAAAICLALLIAPIRLHLVQPLVDITRSLAVNGSIDPPLHDARYNIYASIASAIRHDVGPDDVKRVLAVEVGIIGHLLPEFEIRDVVGLATPVNDPSDLWNFEKRIAQDDPTYLIHHRPPGPGFLFDVGGRETYYRSVSVPATGFPSSLYRRSQALEDGRIASLLRLSRLPIKTTFPLQFVQEASSEPVLFAHAPSRLRLNLRMPARQVTLQFGLLEEAYSAGKAGDGVEFKLFAIDQTGMASLLWSRDVDPYNRIGDRGKQLAIVELPDPDSYQFLELVTHEKANASWDWSYWANADMN